MKKSNQKVISNKFKWIPINERVDRLGLPLPPRKPEAKKPLLWIAIDSSDEWVEDIYLVNETGKILERVIAGSGGFQTVDDDVLNLTGSDVMYKDIANGDAVKVDEYHKMYDSDYVLQLQIQVKMNGEWIKLRPLVEKGGFKEEILL